MRVILESDEESDLLLCLKAARSLLSDGYKECVYCYGDEESGIFIFAKKTKTGVSARKSYKA